MSRDTLARSFGREAFGLSPENYHSARPAYPPAVWELLRQQAGLRAGISILEIGAGTGLATEHLLAHDPRRLLAVEPDARLAEFLRTRLPRPELELVERPLRHAGGAALDRRTRPYPASVSEARQPEAVEIVAGGISLDEV